MILGPKHLTSVIAIPCMALTISSTAAADSVAHKRPTQEPSAMDVRHDALNRMYNLADARPTAQELRATQIRGDALNRIYRLGRYAPAAETFDWTDAGVGASATLGRSEEHTV